MSFELIPLMEIVRLLNQIDLKNLVLVDKKINSLFFPYLQKFKEYMSTRASCLSIYITEDFSEYMIRYNFKALIGEDTVDLIQPGKFMAEKEERDRNIPSRLITNLIPDIPIKNGDIVKVLTNPAAFHFKKNFDYGLILENEFCLNYIFLDDDIIYLSGEGIGEKEFAPLLWEYSIYHWCWLFPYLEILMRLPINLYFDKEGDPIYLEMDSGKFLSRIDCKGVVLKRYKYPMLAIEYKDYEYACVSRFSSPRY